MKSTSYAADVHESHIASDESIVVQSRDHHYHERSRSRSQQMALNRENTNTLTKPSTSSSPKRTKYLRRIKYRRLKRYLHNSEAHTYCMRPCKSWLAVIGYYLIFIIIAVAVFLILLWVCVVFVKNRQNKPWMSKKHLIDDNIPGISYLPNIDYLSDSVIWYKVNKKNPEGRAKSYVKQIDEHFDKLERTCAKNKDQTCNFNRSNLGPCGETNFGFDSSSPCVVVRLNKLEDWAPKGYAESDLPKDMPEHLKEQIKSTKETRLWIDCVGADVYDKDHLNPIEYYPMNGYPISAFPYTESNREYYVTPIVVLHLSKIDNGRVLCLQCNLYAPNYMQEVHYDMQTKTYIYVEGTDH